MLNLQTDLILNKTFSYNILYYTMHPEAEYNVGKKGKKYDQWSFLPTYFIFECSVFAFPHIAFLYKMWRKTYVPTLKI